MGKEDKKIFKPDLLSIFSLIYFPIFISNMFDFIFKINGLKKLLICEDF